MDKEISSYVVWGAGVCGPGISQPDNKKCVFHIMIRLDFVGWFVTIAY